METEVALIPEESNTKAPGGSKLADKFGFLKFFAGGYNKGAVAISAIMLLAPIILGNTTGGLGNDKYIKRHFYLLHYANETTDPANISEKDFPPNVWSLGFLFPFGGLFGSIAAGYMVEKYGRRIPTILFCMAGVAGAMLKCFSRYEHIALLFFGRFVDGISASGLMVSAVLLMLETLPTHLQMVFKPMIQIGVTIGACMQCVFSLYSIVTINWNFVYIQTMIVSMIMAIAAYFSPESPKYIYFKTGDEEKTIKVFKQLRGKFFNQEEVDQVKEEIKKEQNIKKMSFHELFKNPRLKLATVSLIVLHFGQQICGINSIMAFAPALFTLMGFDHPDVSALIVIFVAFFGAILFAPIVEKQRRKLLWNAGFILMAVSFIGFLICYNYNLPSGLSIFFLGMFVFVFQIGPGPVTWFISVEMFPQSATGAAQGLALFFNWFGNTLVFLLSPIMLDAMKEKMLVVFIVIHIIILFYSLIFLVETLNHTPDEVLDTYQQKREHLEKLILT